MYGVAAKQRSTISLWIKGHEPYNSTHFPPALKQSNLPKDGYEDVMHCGESKRQGNTGLQPLVKYESLQVSLSAYPWNLLIYTDPSPIVCVRVAEAFDSESGNILQHSRGNKKQSHNCINHILSLLTLS